LPTLIGEHYNTGDLNSASALERSFWAKGWGRLVWQAFRKPAPHNVDRGRHPPGEPQEMRWPTSVATMCSTSSGDRRSVNQPAKRSISRPHGRSPPTAGHRHPSALRRVQIRIALRYTPSASELPLTLRQTVEPTRFSQKAPMPLPL